MGKLEMSREEICIPSALSRSSTDGLVDRFVCPAEVGVRVQFPLFVGLRKVSAAAWFPVC